ncbi:scavenger receptor class F member 2-like [Lytechinus pictus]|uniref:scavenger receptor class F member 2-like n=1 Tax=Lytechinus pictus TaxID=7653 RepID=UPI0030BA2A73
MSEFTCNDSKLNQNPITTNYRVRCGQVTCNRGQICDEQSQTCGCQPGYRGPRCDRKCEVGHYGVDCRGLCVCSHYEVCHHVTGTCSSSEDDSDGEEMMNPLRPYDRLPPGNGTAMCRSSCGVLSKIGCTCALDGGTCKCPGYVIALFVVSITTWITLGGVCVVCSIRRRRYKSKIEYKRDSDYCEELDSDEETELGTNSTQPTTVTTASEINTSANESSSSPPPSLLPPPPPPPASLPPSSSSSSPALPMRPPDVNKHHVRFAGSTSPHLKHSPPPDPPIPEPSDSRSLESSTSSDDSHVYLNVDHVDREDSMYSIDYSHPYEYLNKNGENGLLGGGLNGDDPLEMSPECFLLQYMVQRQMRALNNAPHGYVNDSVAKWQDRNISKRLFPFGQAPFPINSNTPAAVVVGAAANRGRNEAREILQSAFRRNGKPTIKPKPDVLKRVPPSKKSGPHQRLLEKSESTESESEHVILNGCSLTNGTNRRNNNPDTRTDSNSNPKQISCQQLKPVIQERPGTVPSPLKYRDDDDEGEDILSSSDDHIYENSQIRKPCYRFANKSRSTDQLSS